MSEKGIGSFLVTPQALYLVPREHHLLSSIDETYFPGGYCNALGTGDTEVTWQEASFSATRRRHRQVKLGTKGRYHVTDKVGKD